MNLLSSPHRRALLRAAFQLVSALTVGRTLGLFRPLSAQTVEPKRWDVVVVGGGLAGLAAAETVAAAGRTVLVLEAQDRLGGRVDTVRQQIAGHGELVFERGAQLFHEDMRELRALLRRAQMHEVMLPAGATLARIEAESRRVVNGDAVAGDLDFEGIERLVATRDRSVEAALHALSEDARRRGRPLDAEVLASALTELIGLALPDVSARGLLDISRTHHGQHEEDRQASDGLEGIVRALAGNLPVAPRLNSPVAAIRRHEHGLGVHLAKAGATEQPILAHRVIVAVPPTVAHQIEIEGASGALREAFSAWAPGQMTKVVAVYADRFWLSAPASPGTAIFVEPRGIAVRDVSRSDDALGRVVIFAGGPAGRALAALNDAALGREVQALLSRAFNRQAPEPLALVAGRWVDHPWSGGGYNSWPTVGGPADVRCVLRESRGDVVFAGSELSLRYAGFMEGAIASGRDAARRVLRSLTALRR